MSDTEKAAGDLQPCCLGRGECQAPPDVGPCGPLADVRWCFYCLARRPHLDATCGGCGSHNEPDTNPAALVEPRAHTDAESGETRDAPSCRHKGGTDDCPEICWLLYGDRFVRARASAETAEGSSDE